MHWFLLSLLMMSSLLLPMDLSASPRGERPQQDLRAVLVDLSVHHPRVVQKARELAARLAEAKSRHRLYPDPRFGLAWTNAPYRKDLAYDDQRTPMTGFEYRLSQALPFPGRLSTAAKLSDLDAQMKRLELIAEKNRLARQLLVGLVQTRLNRQLLALTMEYVPRVKITADTARTRYAVGRGTLADVARADLMQSQYEQRVIAVRGQLDEEARRLDYLLLPLNEQGGGAAIDLPKLEEGLKSYADFLKSVQKRDVQGLPAESVVVALRKIQIERGQTAQALTAFEYLPDAELFAAYRVRANIPNDPVRGEDFFSFGVTFRIPLWSALSTPPLRAARRAETQAASAGHRDASAEVKAMFRASVTRYDSLSEELLLYNQRLIPQARRARDSARQAYETGNVDFEVLLVSWDALFMREAERIRLRARKELELFTMADLYNQILPDVQAKNAELPRGGKP